MIALMGRGKIRMSKFIKLVPTKIAIDEESLSEAFENARKEGNAFILIYRDKVTKEYFIHSAGYTAAEGLFAAEMLRDLAMYGDGDDDGDRKVKFN